MAGTATQGKETPEGDELEASVMAEAQRKPPRYSDLSSSDDDDDDERDNEKERMLKERLQFYREKYGESSSLLPGRRDDEQEKQGSASSSDNDESEKAEKPNEVEDQMAQFVANRSQRLTTNDIDENPNLKFEDLNPGHPAKAVELAREANDAPQMMM